MANSFKILKERMSTDAQQRVAEKTDQLLNGLPLQELRQARSWSQEELAKTLGVQQSAVSKMERRADIYLSTLRKFIEAMGGTLEIVAHFPEGDVNVKHFEDLGQNEIEAH